MGKLEEYINKIEAGLYDIFPADTLPQGEVVKAAKYSLSAGGKRIRPVLTLAFCEMCGGDPDKAMAQVKQAVDDYCGKFWTEVYKDSNDALIFAATDAGYKNVFMNATEEQKQALTEQQKQEVWRLIETKSMKKIRRSSAVSSSE